MSEQSEQDKQAAAVAKEFKKRERQEYLLKVKCDFHEGMIFILLSAAPLMTVFFALSDELGRVSTWCFLLFIEAVGAVIAALLWRRIQQAIAAYYEAAQRVQTAGVPGGNGDTLSADDSAAFVAQCLGSRAERATEVKHERSFHAAMLWMKVGTVYAVLAMMMGVYCFHDQDELLELLCYVSPMAVLGLVLYVIYRRYAKVENEDEKPQESAAATATEGGQA